eukprot:12242240-Heterocapsa_arctica.AAC.1
MSWPMERHGNLYYLPVTLEKNDVEMVDCGEPERSRASTMTSTTASGATTTMGARTTTTTTTPPTTSTAGTRTSTRPWMLVEWCCEQNSRLAGWFDDRGHASLRL